MTEQTEPTPGPWTVKLEDGGPSDVFALIGPDGHPVGVIYTAADAKAAVALPDMLAALLLLTTNPHLDLGDLVYKVRESEGLGWDGPAVVAWGQAVETARAAIAKARPQP